MPTKKQRRRHQKARRHDYEYVYLDDEGNEVPVDPSELRAERNGRRDAKPRKENNGKAPARTAGRGRRPVEPPSWRRSARRALIFGPILVAAMMLLNRNLPLQQQLFPAIFLIAFFIPFSYFTDSLAYRMLQKRLGRRDKAKTP
ncbi:MAG: hypothetical protein QOE13_1110 [Gaiellaceae bacterium]|jgi:hypothetical protein|nr:hypothetical protein [Gaiellaceae bacterium]